MLTNQNEHDIDLESLQAGAADYITKNWEDAAGIDRALLYALERARRDAAERKLFLAQQEFEAARLIQNRMNPQRSPHCPSWDIAGRCLSARATGGDFFDYVPLRNDRLNIVVADVSSHGMGAALVMSETRRLFRTMAKAECDLAEILTIVNQAIIEDTDDFVTLFTVQLDMRRGSFIYAGAGHDGYLVAASGEVSRLNSTGLPPGSDGRCRV
jgi:sigma-B regulation protein RsbU (phosphoserine phosphatase)